MTDFREKLLKAGLVTTEQAASAASAASTASTAQRKPAEGPRQQGRGDRRQAPQRRDDSPRIDPRETAALEREALRVGRSPEDRLQLAKDARDVARKGRLKPDGKGGIRWYFHSRTGELPWIELHNSVGDLVADGRAAIVEDPAGQSWAVAAETAGRLAELDSTWIRLWNPARG